MRLLRNASGASLAFVDIERLSPPLAKAIVAQAGTQETVSAEVLAAALQTLEVYKQREPYGTAHALGTTLASRLAVAQASHGAATATSDTSTGPMVTATTATMQPSPPSVPAPIVAAPTTIPAPAPPAPPPPPPPPAQVQLPPPPLGPALAVSPTVQLPPPPPAPIVRAALTPVTQPLSTSLPNAVAPAAVSSPLRAILGFIGRVGGYSAYLAAPALAGYHAAEVLGHTSASLPMSTVAALTGLTLGFSVCKTQARLAALLAREGATHPHFRAFVSELARTALPTVGVTFGLTHGGAPTVALIAGLATGLAALFVEATRLDKREQRLGTTTP